jgi:hypothetical protein
MNKIPLLLTGIFCLLLLMPMAASAASAPALLELNRPEASPVSTRQKWENRIGPEAHQKLQRWKGKWQYFQEKQNSRRRIDRMLRWTLILVVAALVLGASAGFLANVGGILGAALSSLGALAALGALVCFIFWLIENM